MNKKLLRRTEIQVFLDGKNISTEVSNYLKSLTYTDNEDGTADDLQIVLNDVGSVWSGKTKFVKKDGSEKSSSNIEKNSIVYFKGNKHYITSNSSSNGVKTSASRAKVTLIDEGSKHPYHLRAVDKNNNYCSGVYGWVDADDIETDGGSQSGEVLSSKSVIKKYSELSAVIVQKNFKSNGKTKMLNCGAFEIDSFDCSGPPATFTLKGTSVPYKSTIRKVKKTRVWKKIRLKELVRIIASTNGMNFYFDSSYNPKYKRKEQQNESDLEFLKRLCKKAGILLKVSAKTIVLFDEAKYEKRKAVAKIKKGSSDIKSYKFTTNSSDTAYSSCKVSYTNPKTKEKIEYTYTPDGAEKDGEVLNINEKVETVEEAEQLAKKRLRQKNKGEYSADFTFVGCTDFVSGQTIKFEKFGVFSGKYLIEKATHTISSSGYVTSITAHKDLEGY